VSWPALSIGARKHGHGKDTPSKTPLDYLRQLIGERCERVDNPAGAILVLDIGPLGRWQERPDHGTIGWRQLTILSPWRLQSDIEVFCDWNADGGTEDGAILRAVRQLLGRTIVEGSVVAVVQWPHPPRLRRHQGRACRRVEPSRHRRARPRGRPRPAAGQWLVRAGSAIANSHRLASDDPYGR